MIQMDAGPILPSNNLQRYPAHLPGRLLLKTSRFGSNLQHDQVDKLSQSLIQPLSNSEVSPAFTRKVLQGIQSFPVFIRQALSSAGCKIILGKFITDIFPELQDKRPQGWPEGRTWDEADGCAQFPNVALSEFLWLLPYKNRSYLRDFNKVIRSKPVTPLVKKGKLGLDKVIRPDRSLRHEVGHIIDDFENISLSTDFNRAYQKDILQFTASDKTHFRYELQLDQDGNPSEQGKGEAFAEAFAAIYGGGCRYRSHFKKHFKHTVAFVKKAVLLLEL